MFGYLVLENEMLATPAALTHADADAAGTEVDVGAGVGDGFSAMTPPAQPASSTARDESAAIRATRTNVVDGVDVSTVSE